MTNLHVTEVLAQEMNFTFCVNTFSAVQIF